ncbi:hypothetical protein [Coleofasciculus sp. E2-BRE-01]
MVLGVGCWVSDVGCRVSGLGCREKLTLRLREGVNTEFRQDFGVSADP